MKTVKILKKRSSGTVGAFERLHMFVGCCYCGCGLCFGPINIAKLKGKAPWELKPSTRRLWERHKTQIIEAWNVPGRVGFSADAGHGEFFPCFGQIIFDGEKLPRRNGKWPADVLSAYDSIRSHLPEGVKP